MNKILKFQGCNYNAGDTMVYQTLWDLHAIIWFEKQSRDNDWNFRNDTHCMDKIKKNTWSLLGHALA